MFLWTSDFELRQFESIFVGVMPFSEPWKLEIERVPHFLLLALTYWADMSFAILHSVNYDNEKAFSKSIDDFPSIEVSFGWNVVAYLDYVIDPFYFYIGALTLIITV